MNTIISPEDAELMALWDLVDMFREDPEGAMQVLSETPPPPDDLLLATPEGGAGLTLSGETGLAELFSGTSRLMAYGAHGVLMAMAARLLTLRSTEIRLLAPHIRIGKGDLNPALSATLDRNLVTPGPMFPAAKPTGSPESAPGAAGAEPLMLLTGAPMPGQTPVPFSALFGAQSFLTEPLENADPDAWMDAALEMMRRTK